MKEISCSCRFFTVWYNRAWLIRRCPMKKILCSLVLVLCIFGGLTLVATDLASEPGPVYDAVKRFLGPRESMVIAVRQARLIVWTKPQVRDAIFVMDITGLRERSEKNFFSFPAYFVNSNGQQVLLSRTYQCSWERTSLVVYRCGLGINHPSGTREAPTPGMLRFFDTFKRGTGPTPQVELATVVFIEKTPGSYS